MKQERKNTKKLQLQEINEQSNELIETMKKSQFLANNDFEYKKMEHANKNMLPLTIKLQEEEIILTYGISGMKPLLGLTEEDELDQLHALSNVAQLQNYAAEYNFSMHPDNLYYDHNYLIYIKQRDILNTSPSEEKFVDEYKALIAHFLQKRVSYDEFIKGGISLIPKTGLLGRIREAKDVFEMQKILEEDYLQKKEVRANEKQLLNKNTYTIIRVLLGIFAFIAIVSLMFNGNTFFKVNPYQTAVIKADDAYIQSDYVTCIDAMKKVDVNQMNLNQKYILSICYVKSENLTQEQKDNILQKLSIHESEKRLEYWIYLGRSNVSKAEDIAMQQADDELLLYAYMKEKSNIETRTDISGEEKSKKLEDLTSKIEDLNKKYEKDSQSQDSSTTKSDTSTTQSTQTSTEASTQTSTEQQKKEPATEIQIQ